MGTSPFRARLVEAIRTWYGYVPQVELHGLKIRTTCSTDVSQVRAKYGRALTVRKVGTFETLSDEAVIKAIKKGINLDMLDNDPRN